MNYGDDGQPYVQKTSLAYTQPVSVNPSSWGALHTTRQCEPVFLRGLTTRECEPILGGGARTQPVSVNPSYWGMGIHTTGECEPILLGGLTHNLSV